MRSTAILVGILSVINALATTGCTERHAPGSQPGSGGDNLSVDSGTPPRGQTPPTSTDSGTQTTGGLQRRGAEVLIGSSYRPCSADEDCVLVDVGCDGCCQRDAIAEDLRADYMTEHGAICADYRGAICDCGYTPLEPHCVDARCVALPPEPDAAQPDPYALTREGMNVIVSEAYLPCTEDADCAVVGTSCSCCEQAAINADLVATFTSHAQRACADYQGPVCDCEFVPAEARCVADRCDLQPL